MDKTSDMNRLPKRMLLYLNGYIMVNMDLVRQMFGKTSLAKFTGVEIGLLYKQVVEHDFKRFDKNGIKDKIECPNHKMEIWGDNDGDMALYGCFSCGYKKYQIKPIIIEPSVLIQARTSVMKKPRTPNVKTDVPPSPCKLETQDNCNKYKNCVGCPHDN
jgi:hypothetical protein